MNLYFEHHSSTYWQLTAFPRAAYLTLFKLYNIQKYIMQNGSSLFRGIKNNFIFKYVAQKFSF